MVMGPESPKEVNTYRNLSVVVVGTFVHFFSRTTRSISTIDTRHFFGLFVWGLTSHSRIFHSYGDVTITGEGLQILTYARHSWSLSREDSLACHTYCDTGHPFNKGHLRVPVTLTPIAERLAVGLSLPVFTTLVCRGWDLNTQPSACGANALTLWATAAVSNDIIRRFSNTLRMKNDLIALLTWCALYIHIFKSDVIFLANSACVKRSRQ